MKTREELMKDAEDLLEVEVSILEKNIARSLKEGHSTLRYYCGEELYFKLKSELDRSGFRSKWCKGSRASGPSMIVYL